MKTILSFLFLSLSVITLNAQNIELQFNKSNYNGGYNISCNGVTDGSITMIVIGGTAPYTYLWSNNETTKDISNLAAGTYNVTVTDDNSVTATGSVTLLQPSVLGKTLTPSNYNGYNISIYGLDNGSINLGVSGGTPPYSFLWSNAETTEDISNLVAGNYSVTITDMNNCTTTGSITLTQPTQLVINSITSPTNSGGFNISCYGGADGSISVTSSGGVSPYTYVWSHGPTTNPLNAQSAGNYTVRVSDANNASVTGTITLNQPSALNIDVTLSLYSNDLNLSCHNCANGYINSNVTGGVTPYNYYWYHFSPGGEINIGSTSNVNNLDQGEYYVKVTDQLNCGIEKSDIRLKAPERDDWSMQGNAGTDPNSQYMGTSDATDFVMRTNGQEAMRITSDGDVKVAGLAGNGEQVLRINNAGLISTAPLPGAPAWETAGNIITQGDFIGTNNNEDFVIKTNSIERMRIKTNGDVIVNRFMEKISFGNWFSGQHYWTKSFIGFNAIRENSDWTFESDGGSNGGALILSNVGGDIYFSNISSSGGSAQTKTDTQILDNIKMIIKSNGSVGIGEKWNTIDSNYKLSVCGAIRATKIKVENPWCDYVFEKDYPLMPLFEVEKFINENKHLPGIPKGSVIEEEGLDLGDMQARQMEKIEEIVLWLIELKKENEILKNEINKLKGAK